jgi:hypothetical protein
VTIVSADGQPDVEVQVTLMVGGDHQILTIRLKMIREGMKD